MNEHSSYEISKRLHDKGFRAESRDSWVCVGGFPPKMAWEIKQTAKRSALPQIPCYTFTELWGAMPEYILADYDGDCRSIKSAEYHLTVMKSGEFAQMFYSHGSDMGEVQHESPAECAAMMVEWLLDNGHMVSQ